jgi:FAD/FMN-containing dehydrogenase/Fe-S oxidoreductase
VDEQQRRHILDDLKGILQGELLFDDISLALYSTDASIFQVRPAGVVIPRHEEDVQNLIRYAAENRVPLIPRGGGSGVAGESLGKGLIVDLSTHFRDIGPVTQNSVRVQPGVTCRALNNYLAPLGRRFAPDPASADQCTIGGMLANNASGARVLAHGYTRDHVQRLRIAVDSGDIFDVGQERVSLETGTREPHLQDILVAISVLLEQNSELIRTCQPRTRYNRCGYLLQNVLDKGMLHVPRLLVGSEGTLALFTEATLKTIPIPEGRALILLGFDSLDTALQAVQRALPTRPTACELIDRRLLSLARESEAAAIANLIPSSAEAVLLIEYESDSAEEARWAAKKLAHFLSRGDRLGFPITTAFEKEEIDRLWNLREVALPSLYNLRTGNKPVALIEDVGVPPEELGAYLHRVQDILQEHDTTASFMIHAGSGQVHTRPFLDLRNPQDVSRLMAITEKVHSLALDMGGTVSTQHGTGLARTPWVSRQYGELYPVFRQLKAIFDPHGIFNPGKIVDPDPELSGWPLRKFATPVQLVPLLQWQPEEFTSESAKCNGCGQCRVEDTTHRMCPIFHVTHQESASPRAKANLLLNLLANPETAAALSSNAVREVADLCVNCKMCALECPARVNIPKLMLEAKAANVAEHGIDRKDWFLARIEGFARWSNLFALVVNLGLRSQGVRWVLEVLFGLSSQRRLPPFALRTFLQSAKRRGWTRMPRSKNPRVAYFVDVFPNYNDPLISEAVVAVLQHNGFDVYVPPGQRGSGAASLTHGDVETAREVAQRNLRIFADVAREGMTIVCSEPTAALMFRQDYLDLIDDADARLIAQQTVELTTFLWQLHESGKLRTDFRPLPLKVGHHVPCHIKALGGVPAGPKLLSLIPDLQVVTIDVSCSGMAGTFGLRSENYATSMEAGRPMLTEMKKPSVLFASTECSSCRLQIEDGAGKRTLHPVQILALAYGLLPEVAQRIKEPIGELTLR